MAERPDAKQPGGKMIHWCITVGLLLNFGTEQVSTQNFEVDAAAFAVQRLEVHRGLGLTSIRVSLDEANDDYFPAYRVFALKRQDDRPARIWIDFEDTIIAEEDGIQGDGVLIEQIQLAKFRGGHSAQPLARIQITLLSGEPPKIDWRERPGMLVLLLDAKRHRLGFRPHAD